MRHQQRANKSNRSTDREKLAALKRSLDACQEQLRGEQPETLEEKAANVRNSAATLLERTLDGEMSWETAPDTRRLIGMLFYGGRPPLLRIRSEADMKQEINRRHAKLFGDHKMLKDIWRRHGTTICKRWEKKSSSQRMNILRQAWGGRMNNTHRPDFAISCSADSYGWQNNEAQREAILFPSLNTEDLRHSRNLMVLMHSRAMHKPVEFAHMEGFLQLCDVINHLSITELEHPYYAMMFRRGVDDQEYGKLIDMRMYSQASQWYKNHEIQPVTRGILLLERQEKIWSFLTACARAIMHDLPGERILDALPCKPAPLPPIDFRNSSWAEAAELMPYSSPGTINLDRMTRLLRAKRDEQLDHYFYLREDPAYLVDTADIHSWSLESTPDFSKWKECVSDTMWDSFIEQRAWAFLFQLSEDLQLVHGNQPSADQFQDGESHRALNEFFNVLRLHYEWRLQKLWRSCFASPWCSAIFADLYETHDSDFDVNNVEHRIVVILRQVRNLARIDRSVAQDVQVTMIIAEAQRLQDDNRNDLRSISRAMKENIAELATIAGPMSQIALLKDCYPDRTLIHGSLSFHEWRRIMETIFPQLQYDPESAYFDAEFTKHCGKDLSFFAYPNQGPRTREKVEEMRRAESKLDTLWSHFDQYIRENSLEFADDARRPAKVKRRTEPWSDPELGSIDTKDSSPQPVQSLSDTYRDLELNTERTLNTTASILIPAKIKLKTQGTSNQHRSSDENSPSNHSSAPAVQPIAPSDAIALPPSTTKIKVNARALKTFKTLFFTPAPGSTPGEVPWKDFLYAMYSAGFRSEKMYGSAWKFDPVNASSIDGTPPAAGTAASSITATTSTATTIDGSSANTRSSIIFHEPHPSNKIPYVIARRHGRRLARAYGWSGEMFMLAEKEKGAPVGQKEKEKEKE